MEGDLDRVVGVVHLKELLWAMQDGPAPLDLRALARPAFFVPEMKPIQGLLLEFQQRKQHLALVVNEHGGTMTIASEVGEGTTVRIVLPARGAEPAAGEPVPAVQAAKGE